MDYLNVTRASKEVGVLCKLGKLNIKLKTSNCTVEWQPSLPGYLKGVRGDTDKGNNDKYCDSLMKLHLKAYYCSMDKIMIVDNNKKEFNFLPPMIAKMDTITEKPFL